MLMMTSWEAEIARVTNDTQFSNPDIVIGCVDNRKGRAAILKALTRSVHRSAYWLDIGNRAHDGQVVLGEVFGTGCKREDRLPHVADLFPDIVDGLLDDKDDAPSCSMAESLEKQSLFINDTMANVACNLLYELFRYGKLTHHGQFVNIKLGRITPLSIEPEAWLRFGYQEQAKLKRRSKTAKVQADR